jgi:hypothetical protein
VPKNSICASGATSPITATVATTAKRLRGLDCDPSTARARATLQHAHTSSAARGSDSGTGTAGRIVPRAASA